MNRSRIAFTLLVAAAPAALLGAMPGCATPRGGSSPVRAIDRPTAAAVPGTAAPLSDGAAARSANPDLGSLTLEQAQEYAAGHRRELVAAQATLAAAQARLEGAGRWPGPTLIARVESAPLDGHTLDDAELVAGISQPLPFSDRRAAQRSVEAAGVERERARLDAELAQVTAQVHGAFATARFAEAALELRARFASESEALAAMARARIAAGDATDDEELRVALDAARARQEQLAAARLREAALAALAATLGTPDARIDGVVGELEPTLALPDLAELCLRLAEHPALRTARADVALARAAVELAREQRIPDVNVDLLYRHLGETDTPAFDVGLSIPLRAFDSPRAREREALADADAAAARADATRADLASALRRAHARLGAAIEALAFLRAEVLPRHAEIERIEVARAAGGDSTAAALGAVRRDRITSELAALDAMREALAAWAELRALVPPQRAPPSR